MRQPIRACALLAVAIGATVFPHTAIGQPRAAMAAMTAVPLPGGLAAARAAAGDRSHSEAGQFIVDVIRRSFQTPMSTRGLRRDAAIRPLLDQLEKAARQTGAQKDDWPLPLTPAIWTQSILEARPAGGTLLTGILRSPSASLSYCALLALDEPTRLWLGEHPAILSELATKHAARFLIAAPGLRIRDGALVLPGSPASNPAWEAVVGKRLSDPADFIRAIVGRGEAGLAYFVGALPQLTAEQIRFVLRLDSADGGTSGVRRLTGVFDRVTAGWDLEERPFWRPTLDPVLLASDLRANEKGTPTLPGTAPFWSAALSGSTMDRDSSAEAVTTLVSGPPVDFAWLCEQIFNGGQTVIRGPYQLVLFASRRVPAVTAVNAKAALGALRAVTQFPALAGTLERSHIAALSVYVDTAERARSLAAIADESRARLALLQFQGAVAMIARAALRASLTADEAGGLLSSLSAIGPDMQGEYAGKLGEWLFREPLARARDAALAADPQMDERSREAAAIALLAGPPVDPRASVEWEGTRYRVNFTSAEAIRLRRVLRDAPPYLTSAAAMIEAAAAVETSVTRAALATHATAVEAAIEAARCHERDDWAAMPLDERCRDMASAVARAARSGDTKNAARLAPRLRQLADALVARGLLVFAYAAALGQPEAAAISPFEAASRHTFGFDLPGFGRGGAWRWPASGADRVRDWHLTGSVLGLDLTLARFALAPISSRPPAMRPSLNDEDRVVLTESVPLTEPALLTAADHALIAGALKRGRERLRTLAAADATGVADAIRLPPIRRALFLWSAAIEPARAAATLAPSEVFALGLDGAAVPSRLDAWGVSGETRLGCRCLQLPATRPFDMFSGRWFSGVQASGFADLNLRIAELLDGLKMPGQLMAPVLASATWDFVMNVKTSDFDDKNGWVEFVAAIDVDRVEQYLALLTTDGPLVPVADGSDPR